MSLVAILILADSALKPCQPSVKCNMLLCWWGMEINIFLLFFYYQDHPNKMFVSHRPVSCDGGSVGRAKKKKKEKE